MTAQQIIDSFLTDTPLGIIADRLEDDGYAIEAHAFRRGKWEEGDKVGDGRGYGFSNGRGNGNGYGDGLGYGDGYGYGYGYGHGDGRG